MRETVQMGQGDAVFLGWTAAAPAVVAAAVTAAHLHELAPRLQLSREVVCRGLVSGFPYYLRSFREITLWGERENGLKEGRGQEERFIRVKIKGM